MALSVCFIFTVTIGTFPAVTVEVKSTVADKGAWGESPFQTSQHSFRVPVTGARSVAGDCQVFLRANSDFRKNILHVGELFVFIGKMLEKVCFFFFFGQILLEVSHIILPFT